jgi:hypothetical protein
MHFAPCAPRSFLLLHFSRLFFTETNFDAGVRAENGIYEILERHERIVIYLADRFRREFLRLISRRRRSFHRAHTIKIGNFISRCRGEKFLRAVSKGTVEKQTHMKSRNTKTNALSPLTFYIPLRPPQESI